MSRKLVKVLGVGAIFLAGLLSGAAIGPVQFDNNIPTTHTLKEKTTEVVDALNPLILDSSTERISPSDWISERQIEVHSDRVIIDIKDAQWAAFTNTNSMDPVLDETANAIQIVPRSEAEVGVGDIVSYVHPTAGRIIHRVVYKGQDENGTYFIMKGDNNPTSDPDKVRFEQIKTVTVAIIY
ncbi:MAG: hypothetical protein KJ583_02295 [Nanoarchaeota archaeon]|nr:hypothetical protein [Nanoarchaeota archaeon]MBU1269747.1 hypothetical protein [Nanoarchaeota archaeon]MBU1604125.1 hypothetical protein [Nanoarchaeota archaeon]MBU2443918.1 hypothetical protein [Nanoarchaeota archaeon]